VKNWDFVSGEVLLIDKPYEWTSFDVVNRLRWKIRHTYQLKKIKVGHAGTLDPLATGLLIICTGKNTKRIEEFQAQEKEYVATFHIGATTPCFDKEKPVDQTYPTEHISEEMIHTAAAAFIGEQDQVPPVFSAKKVDGVRAFESARKGKEVEIKPNRIEIKEFEITKIAMPLVEARIVCSKGTYIRAIARDLGKTLESGGYLEALRRTRIGDFKVEEAHQLDELLLQIEKNEA